MDSNTAMHYWGTDPGTLPMDGYTAMHYWGTDPGCPVPHPASSASPRSGPYACQSQCSRSRCTSSPARQITNGVGQRNKIHSYLSVQALSKAAN